MAATERIQNRRDQCIFRLAFQHCPLRKLARKIRGKNVYNVPAEPAEGFSNHWHSFNTVSGSLAPLGTDRFNQMGGDSIHALPHASIQTMPQGSQAPAFSLHQVQVELNREPSVSSMDMDVDPETGERAQS